MFAGRLKQRCGALAGLARIETEQDHAKRAIPYWQRIYTLYRAYTELVVEA